MKALSIRAPWWWWIIHGGKDIENRDWPTKYRGPVAIHASKWWKDQEAFDDWDDALQMFKRARPGDKLEAAMGMTYRDIKNFGGHLVGIVDIVGCVTESESPWFVGRYGFVLRNPRLLPAPIPFKGHLGLFDIPDNLVKP